MKRTKKKPQKPKFTDVSTEDLLKLTNDAIETLVKTLLTSGFPAWIVCNSVFNIQYVRHHLDELENRITKIQAALRP